MSDKFVHLHTHSEYSLLDGASRLEDLVIKAKEFSMPALALTDHGVMYGAIEFYQTAKKHGIKAIVGCEVYVAPRSRFDKSPKKEDAPYHLVLLAENNQGYRNLMELVSLGFFEGFYYRPRVDKELIEKYHQGLIALSACMSGEVPRLIQEGKFDQAKETTSWYSQVFGKGNFFLELQNQNLERQAQINQVLTQMSAELKIPVVATNDIHYTKRDDHTAHDALLCIQTGAVLDDEERLRFGSDQFYLKSADEMIKAHQDCPGALATTAEIADRCCVKMDFGQIFLPHYQVPENYNLDSYLEKLCRDGLRQKYSQVTSEVENRLNYELRIIKQTGFSGYFLVVWDFVKFAKERGIKVGPGRGSVAGSIVAYVLGITAVDPIKNGLFFERFLNPERISMPDIDIDFDDERRDEVINYVAEKYGEDKVAQIITFGTMKARAAVRDAGRVLNFPYGKVDKIAKLIPSVSGTKTTIEDALRQVPELKEEYESDEGTHQIIDTAENLEGLARHDSVHAAGVVISRDKLTNYVPLQRKGEGETVTQYSMEAIERIGLLKMDFLGLRTLTVINDTTKIVKRTKGKEIDIDSVPFDDARTFEMLQRGETIGVFQLESSGMRALLKDLQPTEFEDVVNLLALYRPGPLDSGMVQDFVDRKRGKKPISYLDPGLKSILESTYGTIVYQEQVMQIAVSMAGFSMGEADILRKAIAKPNPQVFAEQREEFVEGAGSKGVSAQKAGEVFDIVAHFAGYGFNKSHSTGYAHISYQTAYLKANYPVEFMAALLSSEMGNKDKIAQHVNECRRMGIEVVPPDVNESFRGFTVVGNSIRFGLSAVRNVGDAAIESIVETRKEKGEFKSVYDFCARVDLGAINKRALESLIKAGAFDSLNLTRKYLTQAYSQAMAHGVREQKDRAAGQGTFFDLEPEKQEFFPTPEGPEEFSKDELLSYEKEMLGLYVSDHPLQGMEDVLEEKTNASLGELREKRDGSVLWVGGIIVRITQITTKKGEVMLFVGLEDFEGSTEVVVFPSTYQKYRDLLGEDKTIRVKGRIDIKEEGVKVIAQMIEPLKGQSRTSKSSSKNLGKEKGSDPSLFICLPEDNFTSELVDQLKSVLETYPGTLPVYLTLEKEEETTTLRLDKDFSVGAHGGLFAELKALLGEDKVFLKS